MDEEAHTREGEHVVASSCQGCLSNCSMLVHVRDGRVASVTGNPASAATRGALCPNSALVAAQLDDPDRVTYALRRTNPRKGRDEDPRFERITLDEAADELAGRLLALREAGRSREVAVLKGRSTGINGVLTRSFARIYGTPNSFTHDSICAEAEKLAVGALTGIWDYPDYDLDATRFVLMWGCDPLAGNRQKSSFRARFEELASRARIVVVDPRRSETAERSGGWLAIVPGTDGALADALAHVILAEGLWNRAYVGDFADGKNRFIAGARVEETTFTEHHVTGTVAWWNEELLDKTPRWAAGICGIDEQTIVELARSFAQAAPAAISWISTGVAMAPAGVYNAMACFALNALVGSCNAPGGVFASPKAPGLPLPAEDAYLDECARAARTEEPLDQRGSLQLVAGKRGKAGANGVLNRLADAILTGSPYPTSVLIAAWTNPAFSCTQTQRWEQALSQLPFLVHITANISETSHFADIVIPACHHSFETWGFARSRQNLHTCVTLEQPCVEAPDDAVNGEAGFAFLLARALSRRGFHEFERYLAHELTDPVSGEPPHDPQQCAEYALKVMTASLWRGAASDDEAAWQAFLQRGVWNSARVETEHAPCELPTPSHTFELESGALADMLAQHAVKHGMSVEDVPAALGFAARGRLARLPHYEAPKRIGTREEFPFVLTQHKSPYNLEGRSANVPLYQQLKGHEPGELAYTDVVKLHPSDLETLGIRNGQRVRVESQAGAIELVASAWDGTLPGVAVKCYGQGHWKYGHVAAADFERGIARGGNVNDIMKALYEPLSASTARNGGFMRVRITPIDDGNDEPAAAAG